MARHRTMADQLAALKRKYQKVSPQRFFYNKGSELRRKYTHIVVWFLIYDPPSDRNSIFSPTFRVKDGLSIAEWAARFNDVVKNYVPLLTVLAKNILPAINAKGGREWQFKAVIGWAGNEPKKLKGSRVSPKNRTAKKRNRAKRA